MLALCAIYLQYLSQLLFICTYRTIKPNISSLMLKSKIKAIWTLANVLRTNNEQWYIWASTTKINKQQLKSAWYLLYHVNK